MKTLTSFVRSTLFVRLPFALAVTLLPASVAAQPVLSVSPSGSTHVVAQANVGFDAPSQTVQVRNGGNKALKWSVGQPTKTWLTVSPGSGVNSGTLTLTFRTSQLPAGTDSASFVVQSTGTSVLGSPATVTVDLTMIGSSPPPPPPGTLTVSCPANITRSSPDGNPVVVTYTATPSGGVAPYTVTGVPPSGSSFPVGTTLVRVTATSDDNQTATCEFWVIVSYSPPSSTAVGPQSTITCPAGAVDIFPGTNNIQAAIDANPAGTRFCLRAGVFSVTAPITPKSGNIFVGQYGAILDGTGGNANNTGIHGAFRAYLLTTDIDDVTIKNLVIRNMYNFAILAFYQDANRWTIEYNEIAANFAGIAAFPSGSLIRNNFIHHNYNLGYQADAAHNSLIENNEISYNGYEQKIMQSANVTFRGNFIHHNEGPGIWYDSNNTGALIENNRLEDNRSIGIFYEISGGATIRNNIVRRTGDTGIFISTSRDSQIYNNTVEDNFRGITFLVNCPSVGHGTIYPPEGFDLKNNSAYDNKIVVSTQSGAFASALASVNCTSTQLQPYQTGLKNLQFTHNSYDVPSPSTVKYWFWFDIMKFFSEWQGLGFDTTGTVQ